jgi:hypothetical protein
MENSVKPVARLPALFARWRNAAWPFVTGNPESSLRAPVRISDREAANREWEQEGGALMRAAAPKILP